MPGRHQHHTLLALISGPLHLLDLLYLLYLCCQLFALATSLVSDWQFSWRLKVRAGYYYCSCYTLGVNHGRALWAKLSVITLYLLESVEFHVMPFYVSWYVSLRLSRCNFFKQNVSQKSLRIFCCCRFTSLPQTRRVIDMPHINDSWLSAPLCTFPPLGFRIMRHWPTVLIITSVTYSTSGFLIWSLMVFIEVFLVLFLLCQYLLNCTSGIQSLCLENSNSFPPYVPFKTQM